MSADRPLHWTLAGFLEHLRFVNKSMPDHAYAWVLGAGASLSSGIPLAGTLVTRWLNELHRRLDSNGLPLAEWATAENLEIPGFEYKSAATFYSRVYEQRFGNNPDEGFAYLEDLMSGKDPSPGYSILAQVLAGTAHKVVISTNFDNLVADALSIYTETFPLVIGHESLANFVRVVSRRPVICKIHRDLLLGPKNDYRSLRRLHESWAAALRALFSQYTPVFIGYGGNDDSLMDLLESLDPEDIKGRLIWCYHERYAPSERIVELVKQHKGALVPVPDFDLLMVLVGNEMGIEPIDDAIETRAAKRARQYREQLIKLDTTTYPDVRRILRGAFERAGGTLAWMEKIRREPSTEQRALLFEQAIEEYPEDLSLKLEYANFLSRHFIDVSRARAIFEVLRSSDREFEFQPSVGLANMDIQSGRLDEARENLELVPESVWKLFRMGQIAELQGDYASAEVMYRDCYSRNANWGRALALFLSRQNRWDDCGELLETLQSGESGERTAGSMALFQWVGRNDIDAACRVLACVVQSDSADMRNLEIMACLALVRGELKSCAKLISALRGRAKVDWANEVGVNFIDFAHRLLTDGEEAPALQRLRVLLDLPYWKRPSAFRMLVNLAEAVSPNLPKLHRKFIIALAETCYDPGLLNALGVYTQWRAADTSVTSP